MMKQISNLTKLNRLLVMTASVSSTTNKRQSVVSVPADDTPIPAVVDNLRTVHSRQGKLSKLQFGS